MPRMLGHFSPVLDGFPEMRQVFRGHRHGQGDRNIHGGAAPDGSFADGAQVGDFSQGVLGRLLNSVELKIKLETSVTKCLREFVRKPVILRDAHTIGIKQHVVEPGMGMAPSQQLKELRMQRRLSAGELEDFDLSFFRSITLLIFGAADRPMGQHR